MKIAVCTLFRNCVDDVHKTFQQRAAWKTYKKFDIINVCLEGDSIDKTYETIEEYKQKFKIILLKEDTGQPHYPSHAIPDRLALLGRLSNIVLECAMAENPAYILWLDSDVTVSNDIILRLISRNKDVVAPMFFFEKSNYFRDTWGYRVKNIEFMNKYPYCKEYKNNDVFEVDSVGLPFIKSSVIKAGAKFGNEEIVDLCRSIKTLGFKIFVDPTVIVTHPRGNTIIPPVYET